MRIEFVHSRDGRYQAYYRHEHDGNTPWETDWFEGETTLNQAVTRVIEDAKEWGNYHYRIA